MASFVNGQPLVSGLPGLAVGLRRVWVLSLMDGGTWERKGEPPRPGSHSHAVVAASFLGISTGKPGNTLEAGVCLTAERTRSGPGLDGILVRLTAWLWD